MTEVTFLDHSGFLVELDSCCLLFDWWKGALPPLPQKPLLVLVSHQHHDHFDPHIFSLDDGTRPIFYFLGKDLKLSDHNRKLWNLSDSTAAKCVRMGGQETRTLPGITVETLSSTDEGVAFLVTAAGKTVYHAGDLNWWHWFGESDSWNRNMEVNFRRYIDPLRGRRIDLAFAPLDPRQEDAFDWGFRYLLELTEIRRIFPMHQWGDFAPTDRFLSVHPEWADRVIPVRQTGQHWQFPN